VKTRLAHSLGDGVAVEIYRHLVDRVFEILSTAPHDEVRVVFDPPEEESAVRDWLATAIEAIGSPVKFLAQSPGDLGARLSLGFQQAFADGADAVAAIGTDCVGITGATFNATWCELEKDDVVFGPSDDGGYYLVAMKALQADLFEGIPWSCADTLARSLDQAQAAGFAVNLLDPLSDVDTAEDWEATRTKFFPNYRSNKP
jgi:rSAM/selenodomain-associated transferase 1